MAFFIGAQMHLQVAEGHDVLDPALVGLRSVAGQGSHLHTTLSKLLQITEY